MQKAAHLSFLSMLTILFALTLTMSVSTALAAETTTVTVTKVDAADSEVLLEGATFVLEGTSDEGEAISQTVTTDENGQAVFKNIPGGEYTVTETIPPSGYLLPEEASKAVTVEAKETTYTVTIGFYNEGTESYIDDPGMGGGGCTCTYEGRSTADGGDGSNTCPCWDTGVHDAANCTCSMAGGGGMTMWSGDFPVWTIESAEDEDGNTITGVTASSGDESLTYDGETIRKSTSVGEKTVSVTYGDLSFNPVEGVIPSGQSYASMVKTTATLIEVSPVTLTFTDEPEPVKPPTGAVAPTPTPTSSTMPSTGTTAVRVTSSRISTVIDDDPEPAPTPAPITAPVRTQTAATADAVPVVPAVFAALAALMVAVFTYKRTRCE